MEGATRWWLAEFRPRYCLETCKLRWMGEAATDAEGRRHGKVGLPRTGERFEFPSFRLLQIRLPPASSSSSSAWGLAIRFQSDRRGDDMLSTFPSGWVVYPRRPHHFTCPRLPRNGLDEADVGRGPCETTQ